jgi:hypothetical protein
MPRRPALTRPTCRLTSAAPTVRSLRADGPVQARTKPTGAHRDPLAPPAAGTSRRLGGLRTRPRRWAGRLRLTRGRALVTLAASLIVLLGGTLATAALGPDSGSPAARVAAARVAAAQPLPVPTVDLDPCGSAAPPPTCSLPTPTTTPPSSPTSPSTGLPLPTEMPTPLPPCDETVPGQLCAPTTTASPSTPCTGEGCIPQPGTTTAPPTNPDTGQPGEGEEPEDECGITDIGACITEAINAFFRGIVEAALNPLLDLLANTLLTTPTPDSLPRIGELWNNSWEILLVSYGLLVLLAGVIVMGYQTLQTRHSIKEIAPRLVVGFLAGALSLWVATKGILIANALAQAVMGGGVDASQPMVGPGAALKDMILGSLTGGIWIIFMGIFLAGMLVVLLVTYVIRVAITLVLIAGAPLALMFHALPQTEGIAYWWWKAIGGCLAIQIVQSLTLVTAMRVFFAPGGFTMFGPNVDGLVNLLVAMALMYLLFKIPFWILGSLRVGNGRSLVGSLARGWLAYKAFGLLGGRGGGGHTPQPTGGGGRGGNGDGGRGPTDPYAHSRTTADGQYVLPLTGVRRSRQAAQPAPVPKPKAGRGRQLALPLGGDWQENKPVLGRDGQYRLPLDARRVKPPPPASPAKPGTGRRRRGGHQLELPFDPYNGNRPTRSGQYPLPLDGVRRVPRPPSTPPPAAPLARTRSTQLELPFDPYKGNRAARSGQYPLPLDGVRRAPLAKPAPTPPPGPVPPAGQQLRLPLDLPKTTRRPSPPPTPGGKS